MLPATFNAITVADVDQLVVNAVPEGARLDYKRDAVGAAGEDRREFAYDVSSLANTLGGDLVFGVEETQGVASGAPGILILDADAEIRRLDSILQSSLDPRISGVRMRAVRDASRIFLIVRVPQSAWGLHMVTANGVQRFYGRNNAGKYLLDVHQIRAAFLAGGEMASRAHVFHEQRVATIMDRQSPLQPPWYGAFVLHLLPASRFSRPTTVDLALARKSGRVVPLYPDGGDYRFNADGLLVEVPRAYALLFRTGELETVSAEWFRDTLPSRSITEAVIDSVRRYAALCGDLQISPPIFVMATLFGLKDIKMALPAPHFGRVGHVERGFDRNVLTLPDATIESFDVDYAPVVKPILDALWQAAGCERCEDLGKDGRLLPYE